MRKFIIILALLLGIFFILTRFADLQSVWAVFQRGKLHFLLLGVALQALWIYNLGAFYQSVYRVLGLSEKRLYLSRLAVAALFMTVVAPSGGLSGIAVFVADARRRGYSTAKMTVVGALYVWFEYIGTLTIATMGLAELARRGRLHWPEVMAALVLLAGALGMGLLLYLGTKSAGHLSRVLAWMARQVNRALRPLVHRDYISVERAYSFSAEVSEGIGALRGNRRWATRPLLFALLSKALLLGVMLSCFLAFDVPVNAGSLVAGLSIAHLFLIVSPTPAGLGIVEGILAVSLAGVGLRAQEATVVALAYRGLSFWLPFLAGMLVIRLVGSGDKADVAAPEERS